jgi:hypothetical protein
MFRERKVCFVYEDMTINPELDELKCSDAAYT